MRAACANMIVEDVMAPPPDSTSNWYLGGESERASAREVEASARGRVPER